MSEKKKNKLFALHPVKQRLIFTGEFDAKIIGSVIAKCISKGNFYVG